MYLDSPDQAKSQNLTPKCEILNVFWTWPVSKDSDLSNWLSDLKKFVLSNGYKNVRNVIEMALKYLFFSQKLSKIAHQLCASPSDSNTVPSPEQT